MIQSIAPSSPSMAMLQGGELVHFVPRHMIEGRDAASIARDLTAAYEDFCSKE
jgi:putative YphP/YqiW family bacilliredoxin